MKRGISAVVATVASVALVLPTASCGVLGDDDPDPHDLSATLTWWDTSNETEAPTFQRLVGEFQREYPGIDVTYVNVPFDQARQRYLKAAATHRGVPDVLRADVGWTTDFVDQGLLADLTDTRALDGGTDDFLPTTTSSVTRGTAVYGVPQVTDTLALLFNKQLLNEAGIAQPPADWPELRDAALKIRERTGAYGFGLDTDPYHAQPFLYGEGTDLLDTDRQTVTLTGPDAVRGIQTAADLVSVGAARRPPAKDAHRAMQEDFRSGRTAMVINGPWSVADSLSGRAFQDPKNLGIVAVPAGSTGVAGAPTGGHNLVVSADSPNLSAAHEFTRFMTAAERQERVATTLGLLPTRTSAYSAAVLADPVRNSFYRTLTKAVPRRPIPRYGDLVELLRPHYTQILRGRTPVTEGLRAAAGEWLDQLPRGYVLDE